MKKILFFNLIVALTMGLHSYAQENTVDTVASALARTSSELDVIKRLKVSGYIQAQYQIADMADSAGIAGGITSFAGGNFAKGVDKRIMLRRARVKFQYDSPFNDKGFSTSQFVFQIDATERGITIKDMYAKITDPWSGWFSVTAGNQNRPFGFEIGYSSSNRESPERGRMSQIIFPNERDMGAMLTIQGPKLSAWNWLKLEAGLFNGTGAPGAGANTSDVDKYKDFIGHLSVNRTSRSEKVTWGLGASIYSGGYRVDTVNVFASEADSAGVQGFKQEIKKSDNLLVTDFNNRKLAERKYMGFDGQVSIDWMLGITTLRAEYIEGEQPAPLSSSSIPPSSTTSPSAVVTSDIYKRNFNGAYFYFIQSLGQSPWQAIVKYDWYDPNTDVEGDEVGKSVENTSSWKKTGASDLKYTTLGLGLAYRWDAHVKITGYYDMVENETSTNLPGFTEDFKDDVFTLRLQYKF